MWNSRKVHEQRTRQLLTLSCNALGSSRRYSAQLAGGCKACLLFRKLLLFCIAVPKASYHQDLLHVHGDVEPGTSG